MIGDLKTKKIHGKEVVDETPSNYKPPEPVIELTRQIIRDYGIGNQILNRVFKEFNDMSLLQRIDVDQKAFNSYVQPKSIDPNESWRWNGVRPITRNKVMSMAAHFVAQTIFPNVFAQNSQDEEDKEAANVMRMLIEWNIRNSDYELSFLYAVVSALVNPITYLQPEFNEATQTIKVKQPDGSIKKEEVPDDVVSGFKLNIVPADEILISNPYQFELQKQRFIIRRRFLDIDTAESLHGKHSNWEFVQPGVKAIFNEEDATFYDQKMDELQTLVEEVRYYNRKEDIEVVFVNNIYMGDVEVNNNPMQHRDNKNKPKYPYVKLGFEPIDEKRFFFYKSQVAKMADDQELYDRMWQMVMDGTFLEVMTPLAVSGGEKIDTNVVFPGGVTNIGRDTSITGIGQGRNLNAAYNAIGAIEGSMTESSQSPQRGGTPAKGQQTAREVLLLEQNARVQLGVFGKMIFTAIFQFGGLTVDLIIHHQTVGEAEEILGGGTRLKFRTFILPEQTEKGKKISKKIVFDQSLAGRKMNKKDRIKEGFKMIKEKGGIDEKTQIYRVNPGLFARLNFMITITPDQLLPRNEAFERALKLEAHARMVQSPFADREAIDRDFLFEPLAKGDSSKYMKKPQLGAIPEELLKPGKPAPIPVAEAAVREGAMQGMLEG